MKIHYILIFSLLFFAENLAFSQTWEEYAKQEEANYNKFVKEQNDCLDKLRKEYDTYVKQQDKQFSDYLKQEWKNYAVFAGEKAPAKPKPVKVPEYIPPQKPRENWNKIPVKPSPVKIENKPDLPQLSLLPLRKPSTEIKESNASSFDFYGLPVYLEFDAFLQNIPANGNGKQSIATFWDKASATGYSATIDDMLSIKSKLNLNDYGYMMLVRKFSQYLYPSNSNTAELLTWFILVRSGYGARIAYQDNSILLLIPSPDQIYEVSYLALEGVKYYVLSPYDGKNMFTYAKDYSVSCKPFDFNITTPLTFSGKKMAKKVSFTYDEKSYEVQMEYDPDLVNFYKDYPLLELDIYFNAAVSQQAKESLAQSIKPLIAGMNEADAVNFLLNFVQTAFAYKTDPQQFGKEKFFFAEEVFFYPFCDCEDRSVLFSYLVRELIGLKVVGLEYPEHMATAIHFNSDQSGDYLMYKNEKYIVADPTYINAPFGLTMPQYKDVSPQILEINFGKVDLQEQETFWKTAETKSCFRGSNQQNFKELPQGGAIYTGYYTETTQLGTFPFGKKGSGNSCFIAKTNDKGEIVWAYPFVSEANSVGLAVENGKNNQILLAGTFTGKLTFAGKTIQANDQKGDVFIAEFNADGAPQWIQKTGLDSLPADISLVFSVTIAADGSSKVLKYSPATGELIAGGLYHLPGGECVFTGVTTAALATSGASKTITFASEAELSVPEMLKSESDNFIARQTEKSIAGLFAAVRLVKFMGVELSGKFAQQALDRYNPGFKRNCPAIYKNLGKISFLKNSKGIITIITDNGQDIMFDKVKITNKSAIAIAELAGGDYKIDIISGIKVGKMVVWYNLNFIKMIRKNGNLLFDYDTDHTQTTVNVKKDILN